jgi:N-methylhydantoinase B
MPEPREPTDPVTLEIVRNAFFAIVRQAGRIVVRSSFSPIIRDAFDFCVTIVAPPRPEEDLDLDIVAMNESLAHFSGVMPFAVRNLLFEYGADNLEPGDMIALNNPYKGGNHLYDNAFYKPVFAEGEHVGGIAIKVHLMDLGGKMAGGYSAEKRNVWEEGVTIAGVPVYKRDEPFIPGFNLYLDNTRLPDNMLADLQAVHSAASFAEARLRALVDKYGLATVFEAMRHSLDYAERSMRASLDRVPDGIYEGEDGLDRDAYEDEPFTIRCRINKHGDRLEADFSGTSRQSDSAINCPAFDAANAVYTAVKFLCDPHTPNNSGAFRCIDVVIPEGTFIAVRPPAATTLYFDAAEAVFNAVVKALLPVMPEGGFAGHFGTNMGLVVTGGAVAATEPSSNGSVPEPTHGVPRRAPAAAKRGATTFVAPLISLGGFGAQEGSDGENYVSMSQQNVMDMSVEALEEDYPLLIARKEFLADRAGPGRWRGGAGVVFDRVVLERAEVRPLILHLRRRPWSAGDGEEGRAGAAWRGHPDAGDGAEWLPDTSLDPSRADARLSAIAGTFADDGTVSDAGGWTSSVRAETAEPGTLYRVITPGGGGWGDPFERDPASVLRDVRDGIVSVEGARRDYGVVVAGDADMPVQLEVDEAATAAARKEARDAG